MRKRYKRMVAGMVDKAARRKKKRDDPWFVYILTCNDGSFYTGVTKDIERRLAEHNAGRASRYTRTRLPVRLSYREQCPGQAEALARECAIKALSRARKERLVSDATLDTASG